MAALGNGGRAECGARDPLILGVRADGGNRRASCLGAAAVRAAERRRLLTAHGATRAPANGRTQSGGAPVRGPDVEFVATQSRPKLFAR